MDNVLLAIILQHVRELAEVHISKTESGRYKLLTPFPPVGNDFPDFKKEELEFTDPQTNADLAIVDTLHAYDFFNCTNNLYYNYSYGIKSQDYYLSQVCKKFYGDAQFTDTADSSFIANFKIEKDNFNNRFLRSTVGDLGKIDFYYTSLTPVQWNNVPIELSGNDMTRLKEKALAVYASLQDINNGYIASLTADITAANYSKIIYDFGFFDVLRQWIDPQLIESDNWKFATDKDVLYGRNDADFTADDVKLAYAQRFYVIKNYSGTLAPTPPATPIAGTAIMANIAVRDHRTTASPIAGGTQGTGQPTVRDHRTKVRNVQLQNRLSQIKFTTSPSAPPAENAGFEWVNDHWERKRAGNTKVPDTKPADDTTFKTAAITCRILPRMPQSQTIHEE